VNLAKRLYELQQIDVDIKTQQDLLDDIERRLGENEELVEAKSKAGETKEQLSRTTNRRKELEWEVDDLGKSIKQISDKLYGGTVKNPKELVSLEQEVTLFKDKLRRTEDTLLDVMAEEESLQKTLVKDQAHLDDVEKKREEEQKDLTAQKAKVEIRLQELSKKRESVRTGIDASAIELYEALQSRKGEAVVKVVQGRCQGCRISLAMSEWQKAKSGAVVQCSSCSKILYLG
jgi:predicted  nucleic acid-binding Zn-ribbon protein